MTNPIKGLIAHSVTDGQTKRCGLHQRCSFLLHKEFLLKTIMKGAAPIRLCEKSGSITYFTQFQNIYFLNSFYIHMQNLGYDVTLIIIFLAM
jgi:hypothetical protein